MENNKLKEEIRFLAVGAAGANVAQMLEKKGYKTYYVNLAKQDLDLINNPNKLHIKNGEGASKNRNKAKEVLAESIDDVMEVLEQQITEQYIFVVYSLGGGTGSGVGTFLAETFADNPVKKVGLIIILPSTKESLQARINAYEALSEIIPLTSRFGSIFILDNNTRDDKLSINRSFAGLFDSFIGINTASSIRGVLDIAEQKTLMETSGVSMIHKVAQNEQADLFSAINIGIYAPIEPNKKIRYIGLSQPETKDTKDVIDMKSLMSVVGEPLDTYVGYGNQETVLYLSGLSFPKQYINNLRESIEAERERIKKVMEDDDIPLDNLNIFTKEPDNSKEPSKKMSERERLLASKNKAQK